MKQFTQLKEDANAKLVKQQMELGKITIGKHAPLTLISGPCVIESEQHALQTANELQKICRACDVQLIYKSSYDKANRSSINAYRGPGRDEGLRILQKVKEEFGLPILTDIHQAEDAAIVAEVCDILQIPAFLARQTDLLLAAGSTGKIINVKKGQFMSPWDMVHVRDKLLSTNNPQIIFTDRGTTFGYNYLISDFRAIPIMQQLGPLVCFDASHSTQLPGGNTQSSGGEPQFIQTLTNSAMGAGADLLFIETHPNPQKALSDASSVLALSQLPPILSQANALYQALRATR